MPLLGFLAALVGAVAASSQSALDFLPAAFLSPAQLSDFQAAVARISASAACKVHFSRHGGAHRSADRPMGGVLVRPPSERRVSVSEGFRAHLDAASLLPFPPDSRLRASSLPDDAQCAVRFAAMRGNELAQWREDALARLRAEADRLRPLSAHINSLMPPTVRLIARGVNTAFMAAVIDALGWLDVDLVRRFVGGFPIVGDIPDSGVYRLIEPVSHSTHVARELAFNGTKAQWTAIAERQLWRRRHAVGELRDQLEHVARKTREERARGLVIGPYASARALWQAVAHRSPHLDPAHLEPRVIMRFGVVQKGKVRAIDDARANGANEATRLVPASAPEQE